MTLIGRIPPFPKPCHDIIRLKRTNSTISHSLSLRFVKDFLRLEGGVCWNRLDELLFMALPKPLLTIFITDCYIIFFCLNQENARCSIRSAPHRLLPKPAGELFNEQLEACSSSKGRSLWSFELVVNVISGVSAFFLTPGLAMKHCFVCFCKEIIDLPGGLICDH